MIKALKTLFLIVGLGGIVVAQDVANEKMVQIRIFASSESSRPVVVSSKSELEVRVNGRIVDDFVLEERQRPIIAMVAVDASGSMREILESIIDSAKILVDDGEPKDLYALMQFVTSDRIRTSKSFSNNHKKLLKKLDELFIEGGPTALNDAIFKGVSMLKGQKGVSSDYRRVMIVYSDGEDRSSEKSLEAVKELLRESDVELVFIGLPDRLDPGFSRFNKGEKAKAINHIKSLTRDFGIPFFPKKLVSNLETSLMQYLRKEQTVRVPVRGKSDRVSVKFAKRFRAKNEIHFRRVN